MSKPPPAWRKWPTERIRQAQERELIKPADLSVLDAIIYDATVERDNDIAVNGSTPGIARLARHSRLSRRYVMAAVQRLERAGLLIVERGKRNSDGTFPVNNYTVPLQPDQAHVPNSVDNPADDQCRDRGVVPSQSTRGSVVGEHYLVSWDDTQPRVKDQEPRTERGGAPKGAAPHRGKTTKEPGARAPTARARAPSAADAKTASTPPAPEPDTGVAALLEQMADSSAAAPPTTLSGRESRQLGAWAPGQSLYAGIPQEVIDDLDNRRKRKEQDDDADQRRDQGAAGGPG